MKVLITRPEKQAEKLARKLHEFKVSSICFPVLEIVAPKNIKTLKNIDTNIDSFAILIFVSPNAVEQFCQYFKKGKLPNEIFAIGKGTANALQQHNINVTGYPQQANSDGLLALSALQAVNKKNIAIFAGEEGKTLLKEKLTIRGANVQLVYTHRRQLPHYKQPLAWSPQSIDVSICTSLSSLHNFRAIIANCALEALLKKPLLVITSEMKMAAQQLGFKSAIILAKSAGDEQIAAALQAYSLDRK